MGDSGMPPTLRQSVEETKVSYVNLGKSGLKVSLPILGAMSFGHKGWQNWVVDDEKKVDELLKGAFDRGLNTWDTANVYSNGVSEELIAKTVKKHNLPRSKLLLLTKCYGPVSDTPADFLFSYIDSVRASKDYVNQSGLSRAAIFNAVEASLKRLETDYIDLLQIHRYDYDVPIEETMKALHDLVQMGKVRYIGASSMWTYQFQKMQYVAETKGWTKFISMQNQYSLCCREEEREMNKFCHETGVGIIPWGPLFSGRLARPAGNAMSTDRAEAMKNNPTSGALTEADTETINRVEALAKKKGWKMSQVALAWIVQKGTIPIVGFSSLERLDEAVGVKGKTLTEEEMKSLEEPYVPKNVTGFA